MEGSIIVSSNPEDVMPTMKIFPDWTDKNGRFKWSWNAKGGCLCMMRPLTFCSKLS